MRREGVSQLGFSMVEFLLVAGIFAVGLLGLLALEVATLRAAGAGRTRLGALALANNALEEVLFEARCRGFAGEDPVSGAGCRGTRSGPGPWRASYDRDGAPAGAGPPFFTVTVTRLPSPGPDDAQALRAHPFQVRVVWREGDPGTVKALRLSRLVAF